MEEKKRHKQQPMTVKDRATGKELEEQTKARKRWDDKSYIEYVKRYKEVVERAKGR